MQKKTYILLLVLSIVLIIYSFSLNREWQYFDERLIFKEELFPIPGNLSELIEVIKTFAFSYHVDSQNAFFSNIITVRGSNTVGAILNIVISFIFNKNALFYHILQVTLHLINTALIWFIFFNFFTLNKLPSKENQIISSLFTLIWALHPTSIEAILLSIINVTANKGDLNTARKFVKEFENIKTLNKEDRKQLSLIKNNLKL